MKTIGILHSIFPFGGGQVSSLRLANELSRHGYTIYIFCTDYQKELAGKNNKKVQIQIMPDASNIDSEENTVFLLNKIHEYSISQICIPDIRFLHTLCQLRKRSDAKLIFIQHTLPFWEKQVRIDINSKKGFKKIRAMFLDQPKEILFKYYTKRWVKRYTTIYDNCNFYVTLNSEYSRIIQTAIKRDGHKFVTIPNMTEPSTFPSNKKKIILYSGRMSHADKRVDRLIRIWQKIYTLIPEWELILIGDGEDLPVLKKEINQRHIPRVHFAGWQKEVNRYYEEASIICLTSTFESFGLCLTEGMSHGCVPIAFNCSAGVSSIIKGNGILVPAFQLEEYAHRLVLLAKDDNLRKNLAKKSFNSLQRFNPEKITFLWLEILTE